jgi:hypothetical protein
MKPNRGPDSYWMTEPGPSYAPLTDEVEADVAVVRGVIAGPVHGVGTHQQGHRVVHLGAGRRSLGCPARGDTRGRQDHCDDGRGERAKSGEVAPFQHLTSETPGALNRYSHGRSVQRTVPADARTGRPKLPEVTSHAGT